MSVTLIYTAIPYIIYCIYTVCQQDRHLKKKNNCMNCEHIFWHPVCIIIFGLNRSCVVTVECVIHVVLCRTETVHTIMSENKGLIQIQDQRFSKSVSAHPAEPGHL